MRKKLDEIHEAVRQQLDLRSQKVKVLYDTKTRRLLFEVGQKVWLFNPQRIKGRTPKLQSNWEGPYEVVRRLMLFIVFVSQIDTRIRPYI